MLLAQHKDAAHAMRTTSGAANPAYDTTMTSPPTTAPAGATLLAPNATTLADPTTPWASPEGRRLPAPMPPALLGARSVPTRNGAQLQPPLRTHGAHHPCRVRVPACHRHHPASPALARWPRPCPRRRRRARPTAHT